MYQATVVYYIKIRAEKKQFFSLCHPPATHECPQKKSAQSIQSFGRLYTTYIYIFIYTNVLFNYVDLLQENNLRNSECGIT